MGQTPSSADGRPPEAKLPHQRYVEPENPVAQLGRSITKSTSLKTFVRPATSPATPAVTPGSTAPMSASKPPPKLAPESPASSLPSSTPPAEAASYDSLPDALSELSIETAGTQLPPSLLPVWERLCSRCDGEKGLRELSHRSKLSVVEIAQLFLRFDAISGSIDDDGVIDEDEFEQALGLSKSYFARRLFSLFDVNGDHEISFPEFVVAFSVLSPRGSFEDKIVYSFRIYDSDGDGFIDRDELSNLLKNLLASAPNFPVVSDEDLAQIIDQTFQSADSNGDDRISLEEYRDICVENPSILSHLNIASEVILGPATG